MSRQQRAGILTREECQQINEKIQRLSRADGCEVNLFSNRTGNTRFAANQLSTSGGVENANLAVQSHFGPKHAVVTTNDLSEESLRRVVQQYEDRIAHAAVAPPASFDPT